MPEELTLDALPQPGEPLQPAIDENNQQILELELQERIQRQQNRLTRWQRFKLSRRYRRLHKQLNRAGYNVLVVKRYRVWQMFEAAKHKLNTQPTRQSYDKYRQLQQMGNELNQQLDAIQHLADEFDTINGKLKAHQELIEWEHEDRENFNAFQREARTWEQQLMAAFRQSPRLHHKGEDKKGRAFIDIPTIEQIIIKDDRVMYLIKTTGQSLIERLFNRWHSALPYGVDVSALISDETLSNLSTMCNRVVTVERSKKGTNLFYVISRLDSPDGIPKRVLYQKIIDWYPVQDHSKTPWCAGVTNDRQTQWFNFEDHPHVLIAGATKGGKSNHVNQMIATFATMNTPEEVRLMLVDLKGGIEFTHWKGLQHQLKQMLTTPEQVLEGLQWLRNIMETRLEAFESLKAKNLASYNDKAQHKLPRLICIVDEMATLIGLGDLTKDLHTELRVLSSQGRAVGIHLLLCTQHSSVDVLPGWVKTNMVLRVSAKMPNHQASMVVLDSVTAAQLPDIPGRMVFSVGRSEIIAQSPFISDDQIEKAIKTANAFPTPDDTEFISVLPTKPKFSRDDAIQIALESCEGKLSAAKIHEVVGNGIISLRELRAMMKQLIKDIRDDGGIHIEGVFYEMRKERNYYILEVAEPADEHKIAQNGSDHAVKLLS